MSTTYAHLTNGDVANLLANHRLVQVHPRQQRYANDPCPTGDGLISLAKERLIEVVGEVIQPPVPQTIEVRTVFTMEQGLAAVAGIGTLPELVESYAVAAIGIDEVGVTDQLAEALATMQSRIVDAVVATLPKEEPVVLLTSEEEAAKYAAITNVDDLALHLAGDDEVVLQAVTDLLARLTAPAQAVEEEPAPDAEQQ